VAPIDGGIVTFARCRAAAISFRDRGVVELGRHRLR
jgi:hypothetical protein